MIKVLHKALNILEFVARHKEGVSLTAIAEKIGEKTTTTSNIVQVLAKRNYLERKYGKWTLGISAYLITGSTVDYDRALCSIAEPILRSLATKTAATAVLSLWRGGERFVLLRIADSSAITVNRAYMEEKEVYTKATGMVLLSYQDERVIDSYIDANGIPGIKEPSQSAVGSFKESLSLIRRRGYYTREHEQVYASAAPVKDMNENVSIAVGIYLPQFRITDKGILTEALLSASKQLEKNLRESAKFK